MSVESRPGAGSIFSFQVPLYGVAAQMRAPLILVAAGDEWTRREVRRVAEEQGFGTHEVSDGVDAVEAALRLMPAAVVIDRVLPRLGAAEVAERLKENRPPRRCPCSPWPSARTLRARGAVPGRSCPTLDPKALSAVLAVISRSARLPDGNGFFTAEAPGGGRAAENGRDSDGLARFSLRALACAPPRGFV